MHGAIIERQRSAQGFENPVREKSQKRSDPEGKKGRQNCQAAFLAGMDFSQDFIRKTVIGNLQGALLKRSSTQAFLSFPVISYPF